MSNNRIINPNFRDHIGAAEASKRVVDFEAAINKADECYREYYKDRVSGDGLLTFTRTALAASYLMANGGVFNCGNVTKMLSQQYLEGLMASVIERAFFEEYQVNEATTRLCNMYRNACMFDNESGYPVWGITTVGIQMLDDLLAVDCGYQYDDLPFVVTEVTGGLQ
ncbi:hypothetical protein [Aeromonas sp.]|uniref:hypothetical protein n=1 Tax=Aeromonas sp. TaxID=647 RepID=UPI00258B5F08|nr:hypothetical protein [Aeromonas sp.]